MTTHDWLFQLTGFREESYEVTRSKLEVRDERLHSLVNGRSYSVGQLEMPSLRELRTLAALHAPALPGRPKTSNLVADVRQLLGDQSNAGALFQVASQI